MEPIPAQSALGQHSEIPTPLIAHGWEPAAALDTVQETAHIGHWSFDVAEWRIHWSAQQFRIYNLDPEQGEPDYLRLKEKFHPDDQVLLDRAVTQAIATGQSYLLHLRLCLPKENVRTLEVRGRGIPNEQGQIVELQGTTQDITERKQLEQSLVEQTQLVVGLYQISQVINQASDLPHLLHTVAAALCLHLDAELVSLDHRLDSSQQWERMASSRQQDAAIWMPPQWMDPLDLLLRERLATDPMVSVSGAEVCRDPAHHAMAQIHGGTWIILPITIERGLWGALTLVKSAQEAPTWFQRVQPIVNTLVHQLAMAIHQRQLTQEIQVLNADLEHKITLRTAELNHALHTETLLRRITDQVRDSLDEIAIFSSTVSELARGLELATCEVGFFNADHTQYTITYEWPQSLPPILGHVFSSETSSPLKFDLQQGSHLVYCTSHPSAGSVKLFHCPITADENLVGLLTLVRLASQEFSEWEMRLAHQVANQCSIALRQSRLYQAAQEQIAALAELHTLKDDFLNTVSHELRSPLTTLNMALRMMRLSDDEEKRQQYYAIAVDQCQQEITLVNNLLDLQRLEAESFPLDIQEIDLQPWLAPIIRSSQLKAEQRQLYLEWGVPDSLLRITSDRVCLERIVQELIHNACKYTPTKGRIRIEIHTSLDQFIFKVRNQASIEASALPYLFNKFYRGPQAAAEHQGGTGLGLALIHELTLHLGGEIQVTSQDQWTEFIVIVPILNHPSKKIC